MCLEDKEFDIQGAIHVQNTKKFVCLRSIIQNNGKMDAGIGNRTNQEKIPDKSLHSTNLLLYYRMAYCYY